MTDAPTTPEPHDSEALVARFKDAFRDHPAGVAIVTAQGPDGPVGLTVSSVASLSLDPPALTFSVIRTGKAASALLQAPTFVVHLLAATHAELADNFAHRGAPRFTPDQGWSALPDGQPLHPEAKAALLCRPLQTVAVGSSELVIAEVLDVRFGPAAASLTYHNRRYGSSDGRD